MELVLQEQQTRAGRRAGGSPLKERSLWAQGQNNIMRKGPSAGRSGVSLNEAEKTANHCPAHISKLCGQKPIKVFTWELLTCATGLEVDLVLLFEATLDIWSTGEKSLTVPFMNSHNGAISDPYGLFVPSLKHDQQYRCIYYISFSKLILVGSHPLRMKHKMLNFKT